MNMAKASTTDLDLAQNIARIIEDLEKGFMPNADDSEDIVWFDIDSHDDCKHVINAILNEASRGSLFRVTFGMLVLCDPDNTLLNPDSDILEPHPLIDEMENDLAREAQAARYWNMRYHQMVEENTKLRSIVSSCADAVGAYCKKTATIEFMDSVATEVYLFVDKLRSKYQREHINTNRWKNRAELAEAQLKAAQEQQPKEKITYEICSLWRRSSDNFCIQFGDKSGLHISEIFSLTNEGAAAVASAVKFYGLLEDSSKSEPSELVKESSAPYPHPRISEQDVLDIAQHAIAFINGTMKDALYYAEKFIKEKRTNELLTKLNCTHKFVDLRQIVSDGSES